MLHFCSLPVVRYFTFKEEMLVEASQFPVMINTELSKYDTALCKYFGVGRSPNKAKKST